MARQIKQGAEIANLIAAELNETEGGLNDVYGYIVDYSGIGDTGLYTVTDGTGGSGSYSSSGDMDLETLNLQINIKRRYKNERI